MTINNRGSKAIGVFDSGLGGLTVVKELMRSLPWEDIVYFGDTARVPYGTKSRESVIRFSKENVSLLLKYKIKMIVVACNTSSSMAIPALKRSFPLPIKGVIEPGAKKAVRTTRNKKIGIIATQATVNSQAYARMIHRKDPSVRVFAQACPLFVPLAEEGWLMTKETIAIARIYLKKMMEAKVDTLILGCTHYPLLKKAIKKVVGCRVSLIDSAREVAFEVKGLLDQLGLAQRKKRKPKYLFLVSDEPGHFQQSARRFLGNQIKNVKKV